VIEVTGEQGDFSKPADGGALVYRVDGCRPIGLVFASLQVGASSHTCVVPIWKICAAFGIELYRGAG
jgi:hypothetical protein